MRRIQVWFPWGGKTHPAAGTSWEELRCDFHKAGKLIQQQVLHKKNSGVISITTLWSRQENSTMPPRPAATATPWEEKGLRPSYFLHSPLLPSPLLHRYGFVALQLFLDDLRCIFFNHWLHHHPFWFLMEGFSIFLHCFHYSSSLGLCRPGIVWEHMETSPHATHQGMPTHSCFRLQSHYGLILV